MSASNISFCYLKKKKLAKINRKNIKDYKVKSFLPFFFKLKKIHYCLRRNKEITINYVSFLLIEFSPLLSISFVHLFFCEIIFESEIKIFLEDSYLFLN